MASPCSAGTDWALVPESAAHSGLALTKTARTIIATSWHRIGLLLNLSRNPLARDGLPALPSGNHLWECIKANALNICRLTEDWQILQLFNYTLLARRIGLRGELSGLTVI